MSRRRPFALFATLGMLAFAAMPQAYCADPPAPGPVVPCDASPIPGYVELGKTPEPLTWKGIEWKPPACLGEWPSQFKFVIALAGELGKTDHNSLLQRVGAISSSRGVRYFSVTENDWRELIHDASALSGPDPSLRREDFTPKELVAGTDLFFFEEDNRSSKPVVYRLRVLESKPSRIVVETVNVTPIKSFFLTIFPPGALLTAYVFTRGDSGKWNLYAVSASTQEASSTVALATASYVNRAQAMFQHWAGISPKP